MDQPQSFEQRLESDMHQLAEQVAAQRERPEMKGMREQELLKEAIRAFPGVPRPPQELKAQTLPQSPSAAAMSPLPAYAQSASPETKLEIEHLIEVAFSKGVVEAFAEAEKSSYFVEDALVDALAGKLYPILQAKKLIN
ncbi:MAG: hypothetical protein KGJ13_01265 [Patescibacteria group bacterium]|nr:hypothetical protein [Patescibacteria group bacterium]